MTLIEEIAIRESLPITDVLAAADLAAALEDREIDESRKAARLRAYLRGRRFPHIALAEREFLENVKALGMKKGFRLTPPQNFEGTEYILHMAFKDTDELRNCRSALDEIIAHPKLKDLLRR